MIKILLKLNFYYFIKNYIIKILKHTSTSNQYRIFFFLILIMSKN